MFLSFQFLHLECMFLVPGIMFFMIDRHCVICFPFNFCNLFLTLDILKWKGKWACIQNVTVLIFALLHNKPCWVNHLTYLSLGILICKIKNYSLFHKVAGKRKWKMQHITWVKNEFLTVALLTTPKPLTVWITTSCVKVLKRWEYQPLYLPPEKSVCKSRSNS